MPKVFTIIVSYNAMQWIDRCIPSLIRSSVPVEIIVVDNGSTDGTQQHIKENYPEVIFIQTDENLGFGKANNIGIEHAMNNGAEYVFLMNQDAWVDENTLSTLCQTSQQNARCGIVSPMHLRGDGQALDYAFSTYISADRCKGLVSDIFMKKADLASFYEVDFVNAAFWLVPAECIRKIGMFDPLFSHYAEDVDFVNRVKYQKLEIGVCPLACAWHDRGQASLNPFGMPSAKLYNWRKVHYILALKNINDSFFMALCKCVYSFLLNVASDMTHKKLTAIGMDFKALFYALSRIPAIGKRRRVDAVIKTEMTR